MKKKIRIIILLIIMVIGPLLIYKSNYKVISIDYVEKYVSESSSDSTADISNFCKDTNVLHALYTIKNILLVAKVSIPLILIILVSIDVVKAVVRTDKTPEVVKTKMASPIGIEPTTYRLGGDRSILLSYEDLTI